MTTVNISDGNCENISINISVVGKSGCGKSANIVKLLTQRFIGEYSSKLDEAYKLVLREENRTCSITIREISENSMEGLELVVQWSQIVVIMYSITDRSSFHRAVVLVQEAAEQCMRHRDRVTTICLLANKLDLARFRVVLKSETEQLTGDFPVIFFETSALFPHAVIEEIFLRIVHRHLHQVSSSSGGGGRSVESDFFYPTRSSSFVYRDKSTSSFTGHHVRTRSTKDSASSGSSARRLSSRIFHGSSTSVSELDSTRRDSVDVGGSGTVTKLESHPSKTSLNSIISSSAAKIFKNDSFKFFKKTKN